MKTPFLWLRLLSLSTFYFLLPTSSFAQGSLTPPGAPAPTMKSLDQIASTGIAINATNTPGDATNYDFIINTSGNYYLKSNFGVTKINGIHVTVAGVTVDLNGFQISRSSGTGGDCIVIEKVAHRCTVKNGSIIGFTYGIHCVDGPGFAHGGSFLQLAVSACSTAGLLGGDGWQIDGCKVHNNTGGLAIVAGLGSTLTNCTASYNTGFAGIKSGAGSTLSNCTAYGNVTDDAINADSGSTLANCAVANNTCTNGISVFRSALINCTAFNNTDQYGISASAGSTLSNCTAYFNMSSNSDSAGIKVAGCSLTACVATSNGTLNGTTATYSTGTGIYAGSDSTIKDCRVSSNTGDGIRVDGGCFLLNNTCELNGSGVGSGIHATGSQNRIDGNATMNNPNGFKIDAAGNLIIKNSNTGGATPFNVVAGNSIGDRIDVYNGGVGANITSTNPWANFLY